MIGSEAIMLYKSQGLITRVQAMYHTWLLTRESRWTIGRKLSIKNP